MKICFIPIAFDNDNDNDVSICILVNVGYFLYKVLINVNLSFIYIFIPNNIFALFTRFRESYLTSNYDPCKVEISFCVCVLGIGLIGT